MPIAISELEQAQRPLAERIASFLSANPNMAFTELEIFGAVEGYNEQSLQLVTIFWTPEQTARALNPMRAALAELVSQGRVQEGQRGGVHYWGAAPARKKP